MTKQQAIQIIITNGGKITNKAITLPDRETPQTIQAYHYLTRIGYYRV